VERHFEHQFEWDPVKALRNAREHGVSFERAATVFLDPRAISIFDDEHSEAEERWVTLGLDRAARCWWSATRFRGVNDAGREASAKVRLISARRADRREAAQYQGTEL
jgi:uncharacterized DUF497 family protein